MMDRPLIRDLDTRWQEALRAQSEMFRDALLCSYALFLLTAMLVPAFLFDTQWPVYVASALLIINGWRLYETFSAFQEAKSRVDHRRLDLAL